MKTEATTKEVEQETMTITEFVFCQCVTLLQKSAALIDPYWPGGMDYVKINVLLFCVLLPAILVGSLALNVVLLCR